MLRLSPEPTFTAPVDVPIPGQEKPVRIRVVYRYRDRDEMAAFLAEEAKAEEAAKAAGADRDPADWLLKIMAGWEEVDAEFTPENVRTLVRKYRGIERLIGKAYADELEKARLGN